MSGEDHPALHELAQSRVSAELRDHLDRCPLCRIERRRLHDALPAEAIEPGALGGLDVLVRSTIALESEGGPLERVLPRQAGLLHEGEDRVLVEHVTTDEPARIEMRFLQLRQTTHPSLLPWTALRSTPTGFRALAAAPPEGTSRVTHDPDPHRIVQRSAQVIGAVAHLHRAGLAHGRLAACWLGTAPTGRALIVPAALQRVGDLAADRRALGHQLLEWSPDPVLPPLRSLAEDLAADAIDATEELLARLVDVLDATRSGALRYRRGALLGRGGMGEVHRAEDPALERRVALKALRKDARMSAERFVAEARLTASLQHPGVAPVHEVGELPDGRPYYAMQVVEGQTLAEAVADLHTASSSAGWGTTDGGLSLRRLVEIFARVAETVGYAHSRGIVHRDLKPDNVKLGPHGVVTVLDWGLAASEETIAQRREIVGTAGYMAPEQRRGQGVDRRADVYALGRILQQVLAGGTADGDPPPAPAPLLDLVARCTEPDPNDRPADAGAVAHAARDWLDGLQRTARAEAAVEGALPLADQAAAADRDAQRLRQQAAELLAGVPRHAPIGEKLPAWRMEERADSLETEAAVLRTRSEQALRAALQHRPDHRPALDALAAQYKDRLLAAEAARAKAEAARLRTLLETHDAGRHRAWLSSPGTLTLLTDPPGARVIIERYTEEDRQLVPRAVAELGPTPLRRVPLAHGSYRLRIRHPGCEEVLYPVHIRRDEAWDGVPPGGEQPLAVPLPPRGGLPDGVVYVPPGWAWIGGDPHATDGLPRRRLWLDGYLVDRTPVTLGRYLSFLDELFRAGREEHARALAPMDLGPWMVGDKRPVLPDSMGRFHPAKVDGVPPWTSEHPVLLLPREAMVSFLAWRGPGWRLPHELEWEKAARGVDGRPFPWGHRADASLCNVDTSHGPGSRLAPVQAFPSDVSPYGVLGMGGNVRDRCANGYLRSLPDDPRLGSWAADHEDPTWHTSRGGSWMSVLAWSRAAGRFAGVPGKPSSTVGFRGVRSANFQT